MLRYIEKGRPVAMCPAVVGSLTSAPTSDNFVGSSLLIKLLYHGVYVNVHYSKQTVIYILVQVSPAGDHHLPIGDFLI